jgi:transcriptional regulator with PAS, ATPase and Fis domain
MMNIEVRLMVSTTKNLCALVQQGLFREDLYYLVMGLTLEIPPLRKRTDDLEKLLEGYIKKYSEIYSRYHVLTAGAKKILLDYPWYGNLLQLESFCERMILTANHRSINEIYVNYLLDELYPVIHQQNSREKVIIYKDPEALEIAAILEKHGGNRAIAAQELGISKTTLWRHMKKCGISNKYDV